MLLPTVKAYFSFLCREKNPIVTIAWMPGNSTKGIVTGYGCVHCTLDELVAQWREIGHQNPTLHTTINRTNLKGRKTSNIESCRVFCVDLDREVSGDELAVFMTRGNVLGADLIVESSPKKYHVYWRCPTGTSLDQWRRVQIGLAKLFNGDYNLSHITALLRVPGIKRLTKEGKPFIPKIVFQRNNAVSTWAIADWLNTLEKHIQDGEAEIATTRKATLTLAKTFQHTYGDTEALKIALEKAGSIVQGQRNVSLYSAVRGYVCENGTAEDALADAVSFGTLLNESFSPPLPEPEAADAIKSGINHGAASYNKAQQRLKDLRAKLTVVADVQGSKVNNKTNGNGNGHHTAPLPTDPMPTPDPELTEALGGSTQEGFSKLPTLTVTLEKVDSETQSEVIPNSVDAAADRLVALISAVELNVAVTRLAAAINLRSYAEFVKYLCEKFQLVGCFRKDSPYVFVREVTKWGSEVKYATPLYEKQARWFISKIVHDLSMRGLEVEALARLLDQKPPKTTVCTNIATLWWEAAITQATRTRQEDNIIVFQNGVLELPEGGSQDDEPTELHFIQDRLAPVKYSHPIWCYWSPEVASVYMEVLEKNWPLTELVRACCPTFWKYCQDWFPHDTGVVEVLLNWFGYSFTVDFSRQKFLFFYGPTRSGKGSLCRTLCALAGWHNYSSSDYQALDGGFKGANMFEKLIITMEETEGTPAEHEKRMGQLKKLLGGERVTFERKYQQPFEDAVIGKFVLQANEVPQYQDKGHAVRARMVAIGFEHSFEDYGVTVDPSQQILAAEADRLATVAAIFWGTNKGKADCFKNVGSRAMQVGIEEVVSELDVVGTTLNRYVVADKEGYLSTEAVEQLIYFIADNKGKTVRLHIGRMLSKELPARYNFVSPIKKTKSGRRGFRGCKLAVHAILKDFPELEEMKFNSGVMISTLIDELGIRKNEVEIEVKTV